MVRGLGNWAYLQTPTVIFAISDCFLSAMLRLVGGAGDIKLTKDGNTLLKEMV